MKLLKAVEFIEQRLTAELTLGDVAAVAGLSDYHFSRVFSAVTGEPVSSYIRRRRLTEAAHRLKAGDDRVIDLAVLYGFDSQAAFSRAFKRQFGLPPGAYRKTARAMPWAWRSPITADDFKHEEVRAMEPNIADKPAIKAVGLAGEFSPETQPEIPALWRRFWARHKEIAAAVEGHTFGLCIGVDNGEDTFTYAAALEVENLDNVPDGMQAFDLPPQTYAIFTVPLAGKEPIGTEIGRAFRFIWNTWLPKSGYTFARAPEIEYYDRRFNADTLSGEIDLYIPVCRPD